MRITRMELTRKHNVKRGIRVIGLRWAICRQKWNKPPRRNLRPVYRP